MKNLFEEYHERLALLGEPITSIALKYAHEIYSKGSSSKEEALEKAIVKAEMEVREL